MNMRVKIHHEGTELLYVVLAFLLAVNIPLWIWVRPLAWAIAVTSVSAVLYLLLANFFRCPRRVFEGNRKDVVVSSADGKVVALEETFEDEYLHCRCIQLSVFMSILNVHANWFPVIRTPQGQDILVRQIAGAMARRIVTYARRGEEANIEDHLGFIKFGSRVDIYLPLGTEILVKIGDKTTGGITEVARLHPSANA